VAENRRACPAPMPKHSGGNAAVCCCAKYLERQNIMSDRIQKINETNFEKVVFNSDKPVLVDCWASWCVPCRAQQSILEKVADKLQGRALIASLNIEENRNAAYRLNIHSIPTLVIFKNREEKQRLIGLQKVDSLTTALEKA
jgi:thioredoxin 1